jgi:CHAT domain-containing protein
VLHPEENDFIKRSFSDYLTSLKLLNMISKGFERESSKLIFNETSKEFYSRVLNIGFQDMDTRDEQEKEKLFGLSEKSRNNVLLETMNEKMAKTVSGIPEILLKKDCTIQAELTLLSTKYFSDPPLVTKDEQKTLINEVMRISDLYQEHDSLIKEFELNNPKYFEMKYGDSQVSLAEIRQKLDPDESLIEYFTGDSTLFIFLVSRDQVIVKKVIINDNFHASLKKYNRLLASADIQDYFRISKMLYHFLLAPVDNYLKNDRKLIFIPDEFLALVPFETLVSDTFATGGVTNNHYLVNDFEICYHYSATLWMKSVETAGDYRSGNNKPLNFIGYSPGFRLKNNNLPYADDEVIKVTCILKDHGVEAVSVLDDQATEEHFKKYTSSYSWIHLATHSQIDYSYPERSGLLFTEAHGLKRKRAPGNDILYLDEIYNLGLHADLVVLSACATGTGKIIKSEGTMALTRGFLYAGASNILYSLWNITDKNTRDFMIGFYTELVSGKSYSAALRAEKLKMISQPETSLPTIWAPYVLMGR